MHSTTLTPPQLAAVGLGAVIALWVVLWLAWKIGKWVLRMLLGLLFLAGCAAAVWWLLFIR